jgi:hypothetical protein
MTTSIAVTRNLRVSWLSQSLVHHLGNTSCICIILSRTPHNYNPQLCVLAWQAGPPPTIYLWANSNRPKRTVWVAVLGRPVGDSLSPLISSSCSLLWRYGMGGIVMVFYNKHTSLGGAPLAFGSSQDAKYLRKN